MKIIDKRSYAVWVYNEETSSTVGFYKVTGADYKDLLPEIVAFNNRMAGKVEVQDPKPWGDARRHTWEAIKGNGFDKEEYAFAHLSPDGVNMTDDDMRDYWIPGSDCGDSASLDDKQELLNQIGEMMGEERSVPSGHQEWVRGPKYEADTGGGYIMRDDTIMCLGCRTVAFFCSHDEIWKVDKNHNVTRDLKPACAEERVQRVEDAKEMALVTEEEEEEHEAELASDPLSDSVSSLAEFVAGMYPGPGPFAVAARKDLWVGTNYILCANEVVRVLQALPVTVAAALAEGRSFGRLGVHGMFNGPDIRGLKVAEETPKAGHTFQLIVTPSNIITTGDRTQGRHWSPGEVWSIEFDMNRQSTSLGTRLKLEVHTPTDPTVPHCETCGGRCKQSAGLIAPSYPDAWYSMPTAVAVLETVKDFFPERFLTPKALAKVEEALAAVYARRDEGQAAVRKAIEATDAGVVQKAAAERGAS